MRPPSASMNTGTRRAALLLPTGTEDSRQGSSVSESQLGTHSWGPRAVRVTCLGPVASTVQETPGEAGMSTQSLSSATLPGTIPGPGSPLQLERQDSSPSCRGFLDAGHSVMDQSQCRNRAHDPGGL